MGRVLTNKTALSVTTETALGTAATTGWRTLEPNDVSKFGAEIKTTPRNPISKLRQRRKGAITDLDSGIEFKADLTISAMEQFMEGFLFATGTNNDTVFEGAAAVSGGYTIPAASSAQAAKFQYGASAAKTLVFARGYAVAANNGLKVLSADLAATDTTLAVAGNSAETAPTNATVELCGVRAYDGDLSLTVSGHTGTLASVALDFTTLGLTVGQMVHVGGTATANRFGATATPGTRSYGYARVKAIAAHALTLDRMSATLVASDGTDTGSAGTAVPVDVLFGRFVRNVTIDSSDFLERSYHFEAAWPGLDTGNATMYSYAKGNMANEFTLDLPLSNKAEATFAFVGTDTDSPVSSGSRKTGASSALLPAKTTAFNTAADFARLSVAQVDETGITTDWKKLTLTIKNSVTADKVLGQLGAKYMNSGNFELDIKGDVIFSDAAVIAAIRANTTLGMSIMLTNADGGIFVDIPSITLGDGKPTLTMNESVKLALTGAAFVDSTLNTSIGVSIFPLVP